MKVAGLFAGIGGFEVGLEAAGHTTSLLCDIDLAARRVLEARFDCRIGADVRDVTLRADIDLVTAGFPCQDLSQAGRTNGLAGSESGSVRYLFNLLRKRRVPWVLIENVPFMLHLDGGHAMSYLVDELEQLGYDWAYRTIDARAFGLPQRRKRVFLLAARDYDPRDVLLSGSRQPQQHLRRINGEACGFYWTEGNRGLGWAVDAVPPLKGGSGCGIVSTPAIVMPSRSIGIPDIRDGERLQGFRPGWSRPGICAGERLGVRWRLVGNAVNVRVSKWIGERLNCPRLYKSKDDVVMKGSDKWPAAAWGVGGKRAKSVAGMWPVRRQGPPLADFLKYSLEPLSHRATLGFLTRLLNSRLNVDEDFIVDLENHLINMNHVEAKNV